MAKNENPLAKYEKTTEAVEQLSAEAQELYHAKIDAIRSMNEDLRQQYDEMLDTAEVQFKETLDFYYALGNKLSSIETSNEETYGPAPIDKLVAAWSIGESLSTSAWISLSSTHSQSSTRYEKSAFHGRTPPLS